jgi:RNA polymerase sigma-70 factor, ECF subfamily
MDGIHGVNGVIARTATEGSRSAATGGASVSAFATDVAAGRAGATAAPPSFSGAPTDESHLVGQLRSGDEEAFAWLVDRYGSWLRSLARMYASDAVADDVVQETWIAVVRQVDRFEGRSMLRTWIARILINIARDRAGREARQIPFSAFADLDGTGEPTVDVARFQGSHDRFPGGWVSFPERWDEQPELHFLSSEGIEAARQAIASLPPAQCVIVRLRDVEGWSSEEVSEALGITPGNQRVLLHRGRAKVRAALELGMIEAGVRRAPPIGPSSQRARHPDLGEYFDATTDRAVVDAHLADCSTCLGWVADVRARLRRIACIDFVELVTGYLEESVEARLRSMIGEHLQACEGCRNYLEQVQQTVEAIGRTRQPRSEPSEVVRAGATALLRAWN